MNFDAYNGYVARRVHVKERFEDYDVFHLWICVIYEIGSIMM